MSGVVRGRSDGDVCGGEDHGGVCLLTIPYARVLNYKMVIDVCINNDGHFQTRSGGYSQIMFFRNNVIPIGYVLCSSLLCCAVFCFATRCFDLL